MIVNSESGTTIDEVADDVYRIATPLPPGIVPGGFALNQYLIVDDQPALFHTGPRGMFPLTRQAIETVTPVAGLRWIGFSHFESDESGALNLFLEAAPHALPLCGTVNAMINAAEFDRPPRALGDGEAISIGAKSLQWLDAPHLPHAWECGHLFEPSTRTLFCGDLFTQPGADTPAVTEADILGPSEAFRAAMDYFSNTRDVGPLIAKLAATKPVTLACMHGSAWRGDGAELLRALGQRLAA